ncbi:epididymal protein 13 [Lepus europaeus]|uniref:epididymal protein 13 n=1 Tax=Lepus europaeus TaxID=9983 RepID=UPI002B466E11|nr:epididymal protein 13 [Lepus europaeus]
MCRPLPFLRMSLVILVFLGLAEACIPRQGLMNRLSPDGLRHNITSTKMPTLVPPQGLLSLQVLSEETNDCKEEVKLIPATTPSKRPFPRRNSWNFLKCAYMMMTFFFTSYNKGDWCYCHYCNQELDIRNDPCCSF